MEESQSRLAHFLAEKVASGRDRLVVLKRIFGRVKELWKYDMGLDPIAEEFEEISEDEWME